MPEPVVVRVRARDAVVVVPVPPLLYDVRELAGAVEVLRDGEVVVRCERAKEPVPDPADAPVTGELVAELPADILRLVADAWEWSARLALRGEEDPTRKRKLHRARGQARVLRALCGDVTSGVPTATDFDEATAAGLITPRRLAAVRRQPPGRLGSPLLQQHAQSQRVAERVGLLSGDGAGRLRSRSAFAGVTAVAALILTGCASEPAEGDRRCTDGSGRVVDASNCRAYGGGGAGGYYYRYGGSTYMQNGATYLSDGTTTPPENGSGFYGESGGGS